MRHKIDPDFEVEPAMTFQQIAERLGTSENNAQQVYSVAVRKLRARPKLFRQFRETVRFKRAVIDKQVNF